MRCVRSNGSGGSTFSTMVVATILAAAFGAPPACALEARLMKESFGATLGSNSCPISTSTDGIAANYRWYNVCSGYIWIYSTGPIGMSLGVLFGGPEQPEVNDSNVVKRVVTYFRNAVPGYTDEGWDVLVDQDAEGDGCPDVSWLSDLEFVPALRWNCSEFNAQIPQGTNYLVVRTRLADGAHPTFATDGPFSSECAPDSPSRSFIYDYGVIECAPWIGPAGDPDNFLYWLILDRPAPNAVAPSTWGAIKGLFR
ncbi:MAG: hypothetical protein ACKVU1_17675 [bacterium]